MACGTPVVIGSVAALTEVAGDAAVRVDPLEVEALSAAIVALASSREQREELSSRGLARARSFSWERAAAETLNVYRAAAAQPVTDRAAAEAALHA